MFLNFIQDLKWKKGGGGGNPYIYIYWRRERLLWILGEDTVQKKERLTPGKLELGPRGILEWLQAAPAPPGVSVHSGNRGTEQYLSSVAALGGTSARKFIQHNDSLTQPKGLYLSSIPAPPSMRLRQSMWSLEQDLWFTVVKFCFLLKYSPGLRGGRKPNETLSVRRRLSHGWHQFLGCVFNLVQTHNPFSFTVLKKDFLEIQTCPACTFFSCFFSPQGINWQTAWL